MLFMGFVVFYFRNLDQQSPSEEIKFASYCFYYRKLQNFWIYVVDFLVWYVGGGEKDHRFAFQLKEYVIFWHQANVGTLQSLLKFFYLAVTVYLSASVWLMNHLKSICQRYSEKIAALRILKSSMKMFAIEKIIRNSYELYAYATALLEVLK